MKNRQYRNLILNSSLLFVIASIIEMIAHECGHFVAALMISNVATYSWGSLRLRRHIRLEAILLVALLGAGTGTRLSSRFCASSLTK